METKNFTRRNFLKTSGLAGTALFTLGLYTTTDGKEMAIFNGGKADINGFNLNAWISIDAKGKVTLVDHHAEMGQGSYQSVPQILAEELEVNMDDVSIQFAPADPDLFGSQTTGGSSTISGSYKTLLRMGASAREMLIEAAANKWGVPTTECYAENGTVIHRPSGKKLSYGELVSDASKLSPPKDVTLKDPKDYKIIRQPLPRKDTPLKTNGAAIFGIDKKLPGMLYASIQRSPRFVGKVKSFDDSETKKLPGIKKVFKITADVFDTQREGLAVVADNYWSALQGKKGLKIEWDDSGFEHYSTDQLYQMMRDSLKSDALNFKSKGNTTTAIDKSNKKVEVVYETPYESHSAMEPLNCVAHVHDGLCEVWGPIQGPDWVQGDLSQKLGIPKEKVFVNMTFLGGGFGRKAFLDYPQEAALISKEMNAPVKVIWTREDDMSAGPYRPGMIYQCRGGLNEQGGLEGYEVKIAGQNMDHQWPGADKTAYNGSDCEGFLLPYFDSLPNYHFSDVPLEVPIPVMWWRSVYSSTNGFAFESFMDELALAAGKDPLDFRRRYLNDDRYQRLIDAIEEKSDWKSRKKNDGWGVAITECFGSVVGEVVKVSKGSDGKIKVDKVTAVMDCGWYVNPDIISAQVEGSIIMALGAATIHAIQFNDGMTVQKNFDTYHMPRIGDTPEIEVHIMDNDEKAGGVGEPGLPPFAPALCNAIFDLTGTRIRKLPFDLKAV